MPFLVEDIAAAQVGVPFDIGCFNLAIVLGFRVHFKKVGTP